MAEGLREREEELARLARALDAACDGQGSLVVVEGPAGIGKTTLLRATREVAAERGARVLSARGSELEARFPFGIVHQLLGPAVFGADARTRERWFDGAAGLAADLFSAHGPSEARPDELYPKLHGLYWLCAAIAQDAPAVLLLDDAQWGDEPSLRFAEFLARRLEALPVLLVVAARPVRESGGPVLAQLVTDPLATLLRPATLSPRAIGDWLADALGGASHADFTRAVHAATDGNPFLVRELLREVDAQGLAPSAAAARRVVELSPDGLATVMLRRLDGLPGGAPMARAVAVLGDGVSPGVAGELAGLDADTCTQAVAALVGAGILEDRAGLDFVHPLVRRSVYREIPAPERARLHAAAARLIERRGAADDEIAAHLLYVEPAADPEVVARLRSAAARASALGGADSAIAYLSRALAEPPPAEQRAAVLLDLGRAEARTGSAGAIEHLRQAIAATDDPRDRARAALDLARAMTFAGDAAEAVAVLEPHLAALEPGDLRDAIEQGLLELAHISQGARERLADRTAAMRPPDGPPRTALEGFTLGALAFDSASGGRDVHHAAELALRLAASDVLPHDPTAGGYGRLIAGVALMWSDRLDEARRVNGAMLAEARRTGSAAAFAAATAMNALVHMRAGALAEAEADAQEALDLQRELDGTVTLMTAARATAAFVAVERGAGDDRLRALLDELSVTQDTDELPYHLIVFARGALRAALGDTRGALDEYLACGEREQAWGATSPTVSGWRSRAALLAATLGEHDRARALAGENLTLARAAKAPRAHGIALRAHALVGPEHAIVGGLRDAVAVLEESPARLELARAIVDLGAAMRRRGDRAAAREPLRRGQELAVRCGAVRLAARAHEEILATGARPRRIALSGADALTPSERRVADLAATGLTNREIAQELFVTEKTVEAHMRRAFDKLGVRSRTQIATVLGEAPVEV